MVSKRSCRALCINPSAGSLFINSAEVRYFWEREENSFYSLMSLTACVPRSGEWGHGVDGWTVDGWMDGWVWWSLSMALCENCVVWSCFFCFLPGKLLWWVSSISITNVSPLVQALSGVHVRCWTTQCASLGCLSFYTTQVLLLFWLSVC